MGPGGDRQSKSQRGLGAQDQACGPWERGHTGGEAVRGEATAVLVGRWGGGGGSRALSPSPRTVARSHRRVSLGLCSRGTCVCCCHSLTKTPALGVSSPLWPLKSVDCLLEGPEHPVKSRGKCPVPGQGVRSRDSPSAESACLHRQAVS